MRIGLKAQLTSKTNDWFTPKYLLEQIEKEFGGIDFDPCPLHSVENALLGVDWKGNVFTNPPYSNVKEFLNKGLLELKKGNAKQLIFLIIPRTSTKYWNEFVMKYAKRIFFIPYRLKFGDSKSCAPFPSCIIFFDKLKKRDEIICETWKYKRHEMQDKDNVLQGQTKLDSSH